MKVFVKRRNDRIFEHFEWFRSRNHWLRVTVCPDLGGKVHSIIDKSSGKEILFHPGSIRPVRILPRMAFISGGIEVSFPISHTPVQIEPVHVFVQQLENRLYIWCGEREVRYGMHWTVEYSLGVDDRYLTQRTIFHNPTSQPHAWMSWSNAALPARPDSQFHYPAGQVLRHADNLEQFDWKEIVNTDYPISSACRDFSGRRRIATHSVCSHQASAAVCTIFRPIGNAGHEALAVRRRTTGRMGTSNVRSKRKLC